MVDREGVVEAVPCCSLWGAMLPADVEFPDFAINRQKSWCIISTSAEYDTSANMRNHWIPGYFKESLSEDDWFALTYERRSAISNQIVEAQAELRTVVLREPPHDPIEKMERESFIQEQQRHIQMLPIHGLVMFSIV